VKCNDKVAKIANIVAVFALGVGTVFRFLYNFGVGPETAGFNFFFFISSLYMLSFVSILALVVFKPDHQKAQLARTYFNFLNSITGKGFFLIFLAFILCEKTDQGEIFIAIFVIIIGIVDIVLGWNEASQEIPKLPWKSESAPNSQQKSSAPAATSLAGQFPNYDGDKERVPPKPV